MKVPNKKNGLINNKEYMINLYSANNNGVGGGEDAPNAIDIATV